MRAGDTTPTADAPDLPHPATRERRPGGPPAPGPPLAPHRTVARAAPLGLTGDREMAPTLSIGRADGISNNKK